VHILSNMDATPDFDLGFCDWLCDLAIQEPLRHPENPDFLEPEFSSQKEELKSSTEKTYVEIKNRYRLSALDGIQSILDRRNYPSIIDAIRSMVGDDETITSNCLFYCMLCIAVGPTITQILVSWKDVGFNRDFFNYAEGWIFLPPSADSGFETVTRYAGGSGVPFVLDQVKFKNLSAVRKQSEMERDLPSKFKSLAEAAAWTDRSWPTWDLHQFALILGVENFDFMRSKLFPYLFKYEGGCGGAPPWDNTLTAASAIYRYRGGRAKVGILGIMHESRSIFSGEVEPGDAFFTRNLNLALSGDKRWEEIRSYLDNMRDEAHTIGLEFYPTTAAVADDIIPRELTELSSTVRPTDVLMGAAVSHLREKGYIYTEFDLVKLIEDRKRLEAIWGRIPLADVADQVEARKQEYKDAFLETVSVLAQVNVRDDVIRTKALIREPFDQGSLAVMSHYYKMRVQQHSIFNSFIYNERIRIFKVEDVERYFDRGVKGIKDQFSKSTGSRYRPAFRRTIQLPHEKEQYDAVEEWLASGTLDELLKQPLPPGIGPDDSRITRSLWLQMESSILSGYNGFLFLLITNDRALATSCQVVLSHNAGPNIAVRCIRLGVQEYFRHCLSVPKYVPRGSKRKHPPWLNVRIYNIIRRELEPVHGSLLDHLVAESRYMYNRNITFGIEYDYPNINRTARRFMHDPEQKTIREFKGGYLGRDYIEANKSTFMTRPLSDIVQDAEFDFRGDRFVTPESSHRPVRTTSIVGFMTRHS